MTHLSTTASKRVTIYPKNENPMKSPKAPPRELKRSILLNISTSSFVIMILSVKVKKNRTSVLFSRLMGKVSTSAEYVLIDFCFKHAFAFLLKRLVATSFSFDLIHNELQFYKINYSYLLTVSIKQPCLDIWKKYLLNNQCHLFFSNSRSLE